MNWITSAGEWPRHSASIAHSARLGGRLTACRPTRATCSLQLGDRLSEPAQVGLGGGSRLATTHIPGWDRPKWAASGSKDAGDLFWSRDSLLDVTFRRAASSGHGPSLSRMDHVFVEDEARVKVIVGETAGRDPMDSAGIVDAQSVKGADTVGAVSRGFDAGKRVNGRKRHIVIDTMGLLLAVIITSAAVQDRDGVRRVLDRLRFTMPSVALVCTDGGYAGKLLDWAKARLRLLLEIVRKPEGIKTFQVLPRRWVVAHLRLDQLMPPPGPRLRTPRRAHSDAMIKWA
jgi:transposase